MGFAGSSVGKESAYNAGDPGLISGLARYPREGVGYPLQYCWAFLVVQMVKNPPEMRETSVQSLGWKDPLEKGTATHSSILAWKFYEQRGAWNATVHGVANSQTLRNFHFLFLVVHKIMGQIIINTDLMEHKDF